VTCTKYMLTGKITTGVGLGSYIDALLIALDH
jgi:hypothetical protein